MAERTRNETTYRDTKQKGGGFSPKLSVKISKRIIEYCKKRNINKTSFVEDCVKKYLDQVDEDELNNMTPEEMKELIKSLRAEK